MYAVFSLLRFLKDMQFIILNINDPVYRNIGTRINRCLVQIIFQRAVGGFDDEFSCFRMPVSEVIVCPFDYRNTRFGSESLMEIGFSCLTIKMSGRFLDRMFASLVTVLEWMGYAVIL